MSRRRARAWPLVLFVMSCAPWVAIPPPAPGVMPSATRLQVWRGRRSVILREVTIDADSIRGRVVDPLGAYPPAWVVLARAEVDSIQVRPPDKANWFGAGVAAGVVGSILVRYLVRLLAAGGT
jgi:hypothetical protein